MTFNILDLYSDLTASLLAELKLAGHLPHFGEQGSATEQVLRQFLNRTLPERFDAVSGFTFGLDGTISGQSDILIIDRLACARLLRFQDVGLYPIDAVVGRIEVKRTQSASTAAEDIGRLITFRKTDTFLQLKKKDRAPVPPGVPPNWWPYQLSPPAYLFAPNATSENDETIAGWLTDAWSTYSADRQYLPNALIVPSRCLALWVRADDNGFRPWLDPEDATHLAIVTKDVSTGRDVTLGFWIDMLIADVQGLLDRRFTAYAAGGADMSDVRPRRELSAPPFIPTLLTYFPSQTLEFIGKGTRLISLT